MFVVPLIGSVAMFALAYVAIFRPGVIRSWMRNGSLGILPERVRELGYDLAPLSFAVGGLVFGVLLLIAAVTDVLDRVLG